MRAQILLFSSVLFALPLSAGAQPQCIRGHVIERGQVKSRWCEPAPAPFVRLSAATPDDATVVQRAGEKSPALAGMLSLVIPGAGSFYAGHSGHGIRHIVIPPIVVGATALGVVIANEDSGETEIAELIVLFVGAAALVGNSVWSVVAAVRDAHAHNRTITVGPLEIKPVARVFRPSRLDIEITRVRF